MNPTTPTPPPPPAGGTKQEHTPTPWHSSGDTIHEEHGICIAKCYMRGTETPSPQANAALIVERVNGWTALAESERRLAETLKELERVATIVHQCGAQTGPQWSTLAVALLKARSELAATQAPQE
jgi:hypothetical protein